jgi:hypothetical protein
MSQEPSVEPTTPPAEPSPSLWGGRSLLALAGVVLIVVLDMTLGTLLRLPAWFNGIVLMIAFAGVVGGSVCAVIGIVRDQKKSNAVIAMVLYSLCIVIIILTLLGPVLFPPTEPV